VTILDSAMVVGSDGEYQRRLQDLKETPRIYEFQYMLDDNLCKITLAAVSEDDAERLFVELMGDSKYRVESRGSSGHLDYVCPSLLKFYRRRLGKDLIDRHNAFLQARVEAEAKKKTAEEVKNAAAKARNKEQKEAHGADVFISTWNYLKRLGIFKAENEKEEMKRFSAWMKQDGDHH